MEIVIYVMIITAIIVLMLILIGKYYVSIDSKINYENAGVQSFKYIEDGNTFIFVECIKWKTPYKYEHLCNSFNQRDVISHGEQEFIITQVISRTYKKLFDDGREHIGFLYQVISSVEVNNEPRVVIEGDVNAPTQIAGNNSAQNQTIVNSNFENNITKYYSEMQEAGIPQEVIDQVLERTNDKNVVNAFLNKYAIELLGITVSVAGMVTTLYDILK